MGASHKHTDDKDKKSKKKSNAALAFMEYAAGVKKPTRSQSRSRKPSPVRHQKSTPAYSRDDSRDSSRSGAAPYGPFHPRPSRYETSRHESSHQGTPPREPSRHGPSGHGHDEQPSPTSPTSHYSHTADNGQVQEPERRRTVRFQDDEQMARREGETDGNPGGARRLARLNTRAEQEIIDQLENLGLADRNNLEDTMIVVRHGQPQGGRDEPAPRHVSHGTGPRSHHDAPPVRARLPSLPASAREPEAGGNQDGNTNMVPYRGTQWLGNAERASQRRSHHEPPRLPSSNSASRCLPAPAPASAAEASSHNTEWPAPNALVRRGSTALVHNRGGPSRRLPHLPPAPRASDMSSGYMSYRDVHDEDDFEDDDDDDGESTHHDRRSNTLVRIGTRSRSQSGAGGEARASTVAPNDSISCATRPNRRRSSRR